MPMYYHNETLFSEIYLEEITRQAENADVLASLKVLREYREYADTHNLQSWKDSYIHEVLSALGFFAQSAPTPSSGGGFERDHITYLFPMGSSGTEKPLSLCYVVLPEENLDNTTIGRNWAEKIIRALREKNLQWGLLTNGKQWRIYHQEEPTPYETYLEIDLEAILADKAKEAYQIFHKFMKAENFVVHEDGKCQFDRFKKESQDKIDYIEKELANALRQREEGGKGVLSDLCMGYVEELRHQNENNLDDEILRKKIYHGAMLYMFRLLFLFYADARRLLSDENHELLAKVEVECRTRHDGNASSDLNFPIWDSLEHIFVDIDQTYNGGLFSPQESEFTRFLSDTRIDDSYLVNVIFNLTTYKEKNGQEKPISYRDMSVRHLGTLYEGLLEHKLFIAKEDTEVKVAKGKVQFIPASQGGKLVVGHYIKAGEVYFAGDPSERKSTGSYYTPEYIVDYIVRNTVGEKLNKLKDAFLKEQRANLEASINAINEDERDALITLLEENALTFVREKVLDLSVLDPAMGSGHFLVNAANLIANFITEILNEVHIQGNLESSTGYWRRWVVENCIYGVDLNPLAVELAKLSIWILSMAKDQPLSFLNHHLKCGNSLIGAKLEDIGNYPFSTIKKELHQLHLFERDPDFKAAVEAVILKSRQIAGKASSSLDDVREKKVWLEEIDQILEGYKAICDVHTSLYFENTIQETQYDRMVQQKDFNLARLMKTAKHYFHWELEFPDIFFRTQNHTKKHSQNNGFDIVIANPPYLNSRDMVREFEHIREAIQATYLFTKGSWDLYIAFYERGLYLLNKTGLLTFITPDKWISKPFGDELRIQTISHISHIIKIGRDVFESALVDAIVSSFSMEYQPTLCIGEFIDAKVTIKKQVYKNELKSPFIFDWLFSEYKDLLDKIEYQPKRLSIYGTCENACATDDAYKLRNLIEEYQNSFPNDKYLRIINTGTIGKYTSKWGEKDMVYLGSKYHRPVVKREQFIKLFPNSYGRKSIKKKIILKGLNLLDACIDAEGNIIPGIPTLVIASDDFVILKLLLAIINSKIAFFYIKQKYLGFSYNQGTTFTKEMLNNFPIPKLPLEVVDSVNKIVDQILEAKLTSHTTDTTQLESEIDQILYDLYGLTKDEIDIIEGKGNGR